MDELNAPIDHDVIITDDGVVEDYLLGVDGLGLGVLGVGDSDTDNGVITHNTDDTTLDDVNILHNNRVYRSNEVGNIFNSIKSEWIGGTTVPGNAYSLLIITQLLTYSCNTDGSIPADSNDTITSIKSSKELLSSYNNKKNIPPSGSNSKFFIANNSIKHTGVVGYKKIIK